MLTVTRKTMEHVLGIAELAFTTARDDEKLQPLLLPYRYDRVKLDAALGLVREARTAFQTYIKEHGEQMQATVDLEAAMDLANPVYIEHITLTRLVLRDQPAKMVKFGIKGRRRRDIYGWIEQGELYYDNVFGDPDTMLKLDERFGLVEERLSAGKALVLGVKAANQHQETEKSEAQQARVDRDKIFKELCYALSDFHQVCRFAFVDKPQYLERVGVLELSEGYKRQLDDLVEEEEEEPAAQG
ncbi:MAG: hypothetical protein GY950_01180 [bacterium]|nr:hypothetical protein [bacterium]